MQSSRNVRIISSFMQDIGRLFIFLSTADVRCIFRHKMFTFERSNRTKETILMLPINS